MFPQKKSGQIEGEIWITSCSGDRFTEASGRGGWDSGVKDYLVEPEEPLVQVARVGEFAGQLSAVHLMRSRNFPESTRMPVPFRSGTTMTRHNPLRPQLNINQVGEEMAQCEPLRSVLYREDASGPRFAGQNPAVHYTCLHIQDVCILCLPICWQNKNLRWTK